MTRNNTSNFCEGKSGSMGLIQEGGSTSQDGRGGSDASSNGRGPGEASSNKSGSSDASSSHQPPHFDDDDDDVTIVQETPASPNANSKPSLSPGGLWFGRRRVSNSIGESIRRYYHYPYLNWTETPEFVRKKWYDNFKTYFKWDEEIDNRVRQGFNMHAQKRLKGLISQCGKDLEKRGKKPHWMSKSVSESLQKRREDLKFKSRSITATNNKKASSEDGIIPSTHHMGSISAVETAFKMAKANQGKLPSASEIFYRVHSVEVDKEGRRELNSKKAKEIYDKYNTQLKNAGENVGENEVFFNVVGGRKKGKVYGIGSADELFYEKRSKSKSSSSTVNSYCPGVVSQLEERLQQSEKALEEERKARDEERSLFEQQIEARLAAHKERMMKEIEQQIEARFLTIQQQFNCHNNFTSNS